MNEREENSAPPAAVPEKPSTDSAPVPAPAAPEQKSTGVAPVEKPAGMEQEAKTSASAAVYTVPEPKASDAAPTEKPAAPVQKANGVPAVPPSVAAPEQKPAAVAPVPPPAAAPDSIHTTFKFQDSQPVTPPDSGRDTLFVTSSNATPPVTSPKSAGQTCPKCGHLNRAGILVCEKCGTLLIGDEQAGGTKRFEGDKRAAEAAANGQPAVIETTELFTSAISSAGSSQFTENMILRLEIEGAPTPIMVHPKFETSLGRRDPATGTMPDVDLSAYAGYRLGVSRKHAVIRLKNRQLELYDLGSSNGTSINGTRLNPHQSQILRDGDEVLLGKMMIRVLFQVRSRRA